MEYNIFNVVPFTNVSYCEHVHTFVKSLKLMHIVHIAYNSYYYILLYQ